MKGKDLLKEFIASGLTEDEFLKIKTDKGELITLKNILLEHKKLKEEYQSIITEPLQKILMEKKNITELYFCNYVVPSKLSKNEDGEDIALLIIMTKFPISYYRFRRIKKGEYIFDKIQTKYGENFLKKHNNFDRFTTEFDEIFDAWKQTGYDYITSKRPIYSLSNTFSISLESPYSKNIATVRLLESPNKQMEYNYSTEKFKNPEYNPLLDKVMIKKIKK